MRIVVALGGNALLKRGERMSAEAQRRNIHIAVEQLAKIADGNELVIVHGNGPQVGLLALQNHDASLADPFPLDVLDAETQGMIGYVIEQELRNLLLPGKVCTTLLTMVEVAQDDPAFTHPDKPIGPVFTAEGAALAALQHNWTMAQDGVAYRRVVASPKPMRLLELQSVRWLLEHGSVVICAGGGGIPCIADSQGHKPVEAVIDKDRSAALLARELDADLLMIATDIDGVYIDWGTAASRLIRRTNPELLESSGFAAGSMGPKVEAACDFARKSQHQAIIGALVDIENMLEGTAGTSIKNGQTELLADMESLAALKEQIDINGKIMRSMPIVLGN